MVAVRREDLLDYITYSEQRGPLREASMAAKRPRRVHVGGCLTFLFENRTTVRYQVQEMMRTEQIVKEADIRHELDTYNELLGGPGELGCTLLIEFDDPVERDERLQALLGLSATLYARLSDGRKVPATFDPRQVGDTRLSSVQYLKFDTDGMTPVALGASHPELTVEAELTELQREALTADLADSQAITNES